MGSLANSRATTVASEHDEGKIVTINDAQQILDSLEAGKLDVTITTGDVTLTGTPAAPQAQNKYFNLIGASTASRSLIFPVNNSDPAVGNPRVIIVKNGTTGGFAHTVKVTGQTGVTVTNGYTAILLHNGTDFVYLGSQVNNTTGLSTSGARVYNNANIALTTVVEAALTFNSERKDTDSYHDTSSNTSRLTAPVSGLYLIGGHVAFAANATGVRVVEIRLNGSNFIASQFQAAVPGGSLPTVISISTSYDLAAGDYVELMAYQDSGGNLNVTASASYSPEFWISKS